MRVRKQAFIKMLVFTGILAGSILSARPAMALSGTAYDNCVASHQGAGNTSIETACSLYDGSGRRGAMWLNTDSGNSTSDEISLGTVIEGQEPTSVTVYLHGDFIGGSGTVWAKHVHLMNSSVSTGDSSGNPVGGGGDVSYISGFADKSFLRPGASGAGTLNFADFKNAATAQNLADGKVRYTATVHAYRCFNNNTGGSCYSDPITIKVVVKPENGESKYAARATVSANVPASGVSAEADTGYSNTQKTATITVAPGDSVKITWKHYLKATESNESADKLQAAWKTGSVQNKNGTATFSGVNSEKNVVDFSKTYNVPSSQSNGVWQTVCDGFTSYTNKSSVKVAKGTTTNKPTACVKINVSLCEGFVSDWGITRGSEDSATSQGLSLVQKNSGSWTRTVYVKPKQNVKFIHCYYPYAHQARYNDTKKLDAYPSKTKKSANKSYCKLVASVNYGDGNYRFTPKIYKGNAYCTGDYSTTGATVSNTIPIDIVSPKSTATNYECTTSGKTGFYEIVGLDPRNCTTSVSTRYDVGRTFEQHLTYGGTLTAGNTSKSQYSHTTTHSCGEGCSYTVRHYYYWYQRERTNTTVDSTPAKVVVPYNFKTTASITYTNTRGIVYPGATISFDSTVKITKRSNPDVSSSEYATITPEGSEIRYLQFTLSPNAPKPGSLAGGVTSWTGDKNSDKLSGLRAYIYGKVGSGNVVSYFDGDSKAGEFNKQSNTNGESIGKNNQYIVPDVEDGTKYCFAVAVWPADSHGRPDTELGSGINSDALGGAGQENQSLAWRVSDIKCVTVAKKPNAQIWGGGVFGASPIQTSITSKCPNSGLSSSASCSGRRIFGSWAENEVVSNAALVGFASANGYGYEHWYDKNEYRNHQSQNGNVSAGAIGGSSSAVSSFSSASRMTIPNIGIVGHSITSGAGVTIDSNILARLKSRYNTSSSGCGYAISGASAQNLAGDIYCGVGGGTLVIYTTKDFTINHNITVEENGYSNIAQIPQVLIFAPNIKISSAVTRVDAWLISSGSINTCAEFANNTASNGACSSQLTVTGPVFAKTLQLNRTAGAGVGSLSINPAERFNLTPATYLWSYAQAEDLQQAFTTYTRELAPRY